jgi:hypothetical protein
MKFTNKFQLPDSIVKAVKNDPYSQDGHISATGLIQPPRIRQLNLRHKEEIIEDISERIWPLLGNNTHYILERTNSKNSLQEERLSCKVLNWTITGKPDDYSPPGILSDFKVTSVWAMIAGVKPEWEQQLNIYGYLYRLAGFPIQELQIIAILRDWSKLRARREHNLELHQYSERLHDSKLPLCTAAEMWEKPTQYAVYKGENKRATKLLTTVKDAENVAAMLKEKHPANEYRIEVRPGERVRCEAYCSAAPFCNQYSEHKANQKEENDVDNSQ